MDKYNDLSYRDIKCMLDTIGYRGEAITGKKFKVFIITKNFIYATEKNKAILDLLVLKNYMKPGSTEGTYAITEQSRKFLIHLFDIDFVWKESKLNVK